MSKSKVAPKNRITIPRLELNGAVLAKRLRECMVGELDVEFENVYILGTRVLFWVTSIKQIHV